MRYYLGVLVLLLLIIRPVYAIKDPQQTTITPENAGDVIELFVFDPGTGRPASSLSFDPNENRLISTDWDAILNVWDLDTGEQLERIDIAVNEAQFSPDGTQIAGWASMENVQIMDTDTWEVTEVLEPHEGLAYGVDWHPTEPIIAASSGALFIVDSDVKIWNTATGELLHTLTGHTDPPQKVVFSPDGRLLATASPEDAIVKLWDTTTYELITEFSTSPYYNIGLAFSPDSQRLAFVNSSSVIYVWDMTTYEQQVIGEVAGYGRTMFFSEDGSLLATVWNISSVVLRDTLFWDVALTYQIETKITDIALSPDASVLAVGDESGVIDLVNVATGERIIQLTNHTDRINDLAFNFDGSLLASAASDGTVRIWGLPDEK